LIHNKKNVMKYILTILLTVNSILASAQSFIASDPITVASGLGYYHPQIEITNDDKPIVLWANSSDKNLYVSKLGVNNSFSTPIQLNPMGFDVQTFDWSGADLAIEDSNVYVVFRSLGYETGHVYLVKSTDNGLTFGDTVRVDNLSSGYGQYPDVAVLNDTVWVTFMDHDASGLNPQYVVAKSIDGGSTFLPEIVAGEILGNEACDCCQPEIIVNNDYVIVYFRNNDNNIRDIKGVVSYDRGETFTDFFSVDDHLWQINGCPSTGPDSRFINDSSSVTVYKTTENGDAKLFINQYNHNSNSSIGLKRVYDSNSSNLSVNYPQVAVKNNVFGVVWEGQGESRDVFINYSENGVAGLNADNVYNITNILGNQVKPDIAISASRFHVVYADQSSFNLKYVSLESTTSITEVKNQQLELATYPNPTTDFIAVSIKTERKDLVAIRIINSLGQEVYSTLVKNQNKYLITVDMKKWNAGIYYVLIESSNKVISKKIVKE